MTDTSPATPARPHALRPWLELVRLPAVFTAPADALAGMALGVALAGVWPTAAQVALLVFASAALYCAGMAANDVFDRQIDAVERPGRPIPSGRISLRGAWALVLGLQALALAAAAAAGSASLVAALAVVGAVYLYDAGAKNTRFGPWSMALCRYLNAALGLSVAATALPASAWVLPLGTFIFVAGVTGLSRHEVAGARQRDLRVPMIGVGAGVVWAAGAAFWLGVPLAAAAGLFTAGWLVGPLRKAWNHPGAGSVRGAVMAGIFGIAMVNAQLALATPAPAFGIAAVLLLIPGRWFGRWFYAT